MMKAKSRNYGNDVLAIILICGLGALISFQIYQMNSQSNTKTKKVPKTTDEYIGGLKIGFADWKMPSLAFNNFSNIPTLFSELHLSQDNRTTTVTGIRSDYAQKIQQTVTQASKPCPYDFKVYVYDLPVDLPAVKIGEEARVQKRYHICHKCIFEQFSLEYIFNDYFTQFCGRTYDPEEADFFYLPLIRDAEYRQQLEKATSNRAPSSAETALIRLLENNDSSIWKDVFKVPDTYWRRRDGADHIIVMPAPVTNLRHEGSRRGFFHYMSHLFPPIFVAVEYSLSFVKEYPICSNQKNIIVPYPSIDQEFYSGKLLSGSVDRNALLYYAGGLHGDCIEIRRAMQKLIHNCTRIPDALPHVPTNQAQREHGFRAAKYCPVPIGDSPSSKRMYDVINFGCIPVVLSDDLVWAFSDQTNGPFYHRMFALHFPQIVVQFSTAKILEHFNRSREALGILPASGLIVYDLLLNAFQSSPAYEHGVYINPLVHILRRIPQIDYLYLKHGGEKVAPYFQYYAMNKSLHDIPPSFHAYPGGKAMDMLADALSKRKMYGIETIYHSCLQEKRRRDHKYVARYPCVQSIRRRLSGSENMLEEQCSPLKLFDREY
jgi:hypothetical protein